MAVSYQPKRDRILIRRDLPVRQTASGIITSLGASESEQKLYSGYVVAIGTDPEIDVKVGERVLFDQHSGTPVVQDKVDHIIVDMRDILATISETPSE